MKNYILILVCLALTCGCANSNRNNKKQITPVSADINAINDTDFEELEEQFAQQEEKIPDPLVSFNRTMFNINDIIYFWVVKPVSKTYHNAVPQVARVGIRHIFHNLTTPARLANCLLQGKFPEAGRELNRFAINTTVGILGFCDTAGDKMGIKAAEEDFGQTLAVYGLDDGFYIVWPLLGPSTLRDTAGLLDQFLNPVRYVEPAEASIGISVLSSTNEASFHIGEYEAFKAAAVDPYIAMRGAYIQYRKNLILDKEQSDPNSSVFKEKDADR